MERITFSLAKVFYLDCCKGLASFGSSDDNIRMQVDFPHLMYFQQKVERVKCDAISLPIVVLGEMFLVFSAAGL